MSAAASLMTVPVKPTPAMIAAAANAQTPVEIWNAMLRAAPTVGETDAVASVRQLRSDVLRPGSELPSAMIAPLPSRGTTRRNPDFWADLDVRRLVIELHRQVTIKEALVEIAAHVGPARTPSKSALARAWKRLDLLNKKRSR